MKKKKRWRNFDCRDSQSLKTTALGALSFLPTTFITSVINRLDFSFSSIWKWTWNHQSLFQNPLRTVLFQPFFRCYFQSPCINVFGGERQQSPLLRDYWVSRTRFFTSFPHILLLLQHSTWNLLLLFSACHREIGVVLVALLIADE